CRISGNRCRVCRPARAGAPDGAGEGADGAVVGAAPRDSTAPTTSPLVIRPPRPVPSTPDRSTFSSSAILRAEGDGVPAIGPLPPHEGAAWVAGGVGGD